jgi:hypothetical protein
MTIAWCLCTGYRCDVEPRSDKVTDMYRQTLTLDRDENGWVWLRCTCSSDRVEEHGFALRGEFAVQDVWEAALATGWVREQDEQYVVDDVSCAKLRDVVAEMFGYFDGPGHPRGRLLRVKQAVSEYFIVQDTQPVIPLWAYAWLDVMVREEVADEARSAEDMWRDSPLMIDVERYCQRRVEALVRRYAGIGQVATADPTKMAPSRRQRPSRPGHAKTG